MGFQLSPGVEVNEIDLTTIIPAVGTTSGGIAGPFRWGPVEEIVLVDNELTLVDRFGEPDNDTANTFYTAANFLAYGNNLKVVRAANATARNATADGTGLLIKNEDTYDNQYAGGQASVGKWAAKYPGVLGNSLKVALADSNNFANWAFKANFDSAPGTSDFATAAGGSNDEVHVIIVDEDGEFTGTAGTILEVFPFLSKASDAKTADGSSNYYATVINRQSKYVWWMDHPASTNWGSVATTSFQPAVTTVTMTVDGARGDGDFDVAETVEVRTTGVDDITLGAGGSGYTSAPAVIITDPTGQGSGATATATISGGAVTDFVITAAGSGYTKAPTVTISGGGGTGATGTAVLDLGIDSLTITAGGTGYTTAPTVTITGGGGSGATATATTDGDAVDSITITNAGSGYTSAPTIGFTGGGGSGATATATIGNTGAIAKTAVVSAWDDADPFVLTVTMNSSVAIFAGEPIVGQTSGVYAVASAVTTPIESLSGGVDGNSSIGNSDYIAGLDLFKDVETVDLSFILGADANQTLAIEMINNIAEVRKDCVVFLSPEKADVVNNSGSEHTDSIAFRNTLPSTSYAFMDSNWKYQYDKYNDLNRWVPLNGDIAGLAVRTDRLRDPWFSPAGLNRGHIKNTIKLAWNPRKAFRDELYKNGLNPVIIQPGQGAILFGDKTLLSKPSAFDRLNVRRLFIVLEKAIATASKYTLFEFNDEFTRAQFRNLVEPFLRDVEGRRGITDFRVVCDGTNNTAEVIDRNEFIGDIYIKPARSINFITLNFVATRTGVSFDEIVGKF